MSGGAIGVGALALVAGCATEAANNSATGNSAAPGLTDCDTGPNADEMGQGRTGGRTGFSDTDSGASADPAGCGRPRAGAPVTDSDRGRLADPVGRGRGNNGRYSDNDMGWSADPIGRGRRGPTPPPGNSQ
ncbi:MAG: hypothetical protein AB7O91_07280 [Sphingomonas sp.]